MSVNHLNKLLVNYYRKNSKRYSILGVNMRSLRRWNLGFRRFVGSFRRRRGLGLGCWVRLGSFRGRFRFWRVRELDYLNRIRKIQQNCKMSSPFYNKTATNNKTSNNESKNTNKSNQNSSSKSQCEFSPNPTPTNTNTHPYHPFFQPKQNNKYNFNFLN